jgi:hypothetical protein
MAVFGIRSMRLLPVAALLLACQSDPTGPLGPGLWGGTGASLQVSPDSVTFEFDCGHGVVRGTIDLDRGRFEKAGEYVREGGPVPTDPPTPQNAVYTGTVYGSLLYLTILVDGSTGPVGPYSLRHGAAPLLRKCV